MSWVSDYKYTWLEKLALNILKLDAHVPRHIAFVMDGNRRFARFEHLEKIEGHARGFEKLADCLRWCLDIGIQEVTTFAFSIENYKRSTQEVDDLLNLARDKFRKLLDETEKLTEHGVCIRVIGNLDLLPTDLQHLIALAVLSTAQNNKLFLNVAFSYTSRDEITHAIESIIRLGDGNGDADSSLDTTHISERLVQNCLYTSRSTAPELIFRTSGESRLSDFMMWQLSSSVLYFTKILWPQITVWNFFAGIFTYQRARLHVEDFQKRERLQSAQVAKTTQFYGRRVQEFLHRLDEYRREILLRLSYN